MTRQQTLAATLAWSHDLLGDREQQLLRRLSVFAGSFTLEAVEAICAPESEAGSDGPVSDVLEPLARLIDTSLLAVDTSSSGVARYRLLETVRQYAAGRLGVAREADLMAGRHLTWYASFAERHDPDNATSSITSVSSELDVEHDNLRAALGTALRTQPQTGLRLATALWRYWLARGLFGEGRRWLDEALAGVPEPSELRSRALHALAVFDMRRGSPDRLGELGAEIVRIHRALDDPVGLAQALQHEALLAFMRGRWADCNNRLDECLRVAAASRDQRVPPSANHLRGLVALSRGQLDAARAHFEETLTLLAETVHTERPHFPVVMLGFAVEAPGAEHAHVLFEETVIQGRRVGSLQAAAYLRSNLAYLARLARDLDEARSHLVTAVESFQTLKDPDGESLALAHLGCVLRERGEINAGREALAASLRIRQRIGDRRGIGLSLGNLALLMAKEGDVAAARTQLQQVLRWFEEAEDTAGIAGTTLNLAAVNLEAGDIEAARRLIEALLSWLPEIPGNHRATGWALATLAEVRRRDGDPLAADQALRLAVDTFADLDATDGLAHCARVRSSL